MPEVGIKLAFTGSMIGRIVTLIIALSISISLEVRVYAADFIIGPIEPSSSRLPSPSPLHFLGPVAFPSPLLYPPLLPETRESEEFEFIQLINQERAAIGENTLSIDPLLTQVARSHSEEMAQLGYFDHISPTPGSETPRDRCLLALQMAKRHLPPEGGLVGENIYSVSVYDDNIYNVFYAHTAFMNSPGHRANILEPRFKKVGVGVYKNEYGAFWVTETFLRDQR